jgi:hypothetical protein
MLIGRLGLGLRASALLATCVALPACQQKDAKTHSNVGSACVTPVSAETNFFGDCARQELSADMELRIDVDFGLCLSSSCDSKHDEAKRPRSVARASDVGRRFGVAAVVRRGRACVGWRER